MPAADLIADRLKALSEMSTEEVFDLLVSLPHVADAVQKPLTKQKLAAAVADYQNISLALRMLSPRALQLVSVAVAFGGTMTAAEVAEETAPLSTDRVGELLKELDKRLLIDLGRGFLVLRPGIAGMVNLPGLSLRQEAVVDNRITSDELQRHLQHHGVKRPPTTKAERLDALLNLIGDRAHLGRVIDSLSAPAKAIFVELIDSGLGGCSLHDLGVSMYHLSSFQRYGAIPRRSPQAEAIDELRALGLIAFNEYQARVAIWREVQRALSGAVYATWPKAWEGDLVEVNHGAVRPPHAPSAMATVMRAIEASPLPGLKSGGIGVKTLRDLAKRIGLAEPAVTRMVSIAQLLGLIEEHSQLVGRGRNSSWLYQYSVDTAANEKFAASPVAEQWTRMVTAWLNEFGQGGDWVLRSVVRQLVADLVALPADCGVAAGDVTAWMEGRHAAAAPYDSGKIIAEMRILDLVDNSGPVALTPLGRVLLTDPERLDEMMPAVEGTVVVQADHTVIAPPTLDPAIRSQIEALATVTSDSSVRVYRLDPTKIATALAGPQTSADLIEFLAGCSSAALPPSISQLILDVERQRGGLSVSSAATVVTAVDVLALAGAVKVKAAGLTLIAPTVAVSNLAPTRVAAALRAKGLAPTVNGVSMAIDDNKTQTFRRPPPAAAKTKVGAALVRGEAALRELAAEATKRAVAR